MPIVSVRSVQISALAVAIILGGCSVGLNNRVTENDPPIWGRVDCQRGAGNPELQKQFEDAKATCLARGESADAVAGNNAGGNPCMTEQGYVLKTRAEHEATCQAVEQRIGKPATQTKKPKRKSTVAKPVPTPEPIEPAGPAKQ